MAGAPLPLQQLTSAGVRVGLGQDGSATTDPVRNADMLDRLPRRTVIHRGRVVADGLQLV